MLPPGRSCLLNPDKPVDYEEDMDITTIDDTVPDEAASLLSGRPLKEKLYGPKRWLKRYKASDGTLYAHGKAMGGVYSFVAYTTLKLTDEQKQTYRSFDVYDTESATYKGLVVDQVLSKFLF